MDRGVKEREHKAWCHVTCWTWTDSDPCSEQSRCKENKQVSHWSPYHQSPLSENEKLLRTQRTHALCAWTWLTIYTSYLHNTYAMVTSFKSHKSWVSEWVSEREAWQWLDLGDIKLLLSEKMKQHNLTLPFQLIWPYQFSQTAVIQSQNRQKWIEQLSLFFRPRFVGQNHV